MSVLTVRGRWSRLAKACASRRTIRQTPNCTRRRSRSTRRRSHRTPMRARSPHEGVPGRRAASTRRRLQTRARPSSSTAPTCRRTRSSCAHAFRSAALMTPRATSIPSSSRTTTSPSWSDWQRPSLRRSALAVTLSRAATSSGRRRCSTRCSDTRPHHLFSSGSRAPSSASASATRRSVARASSSKRTRQMHPRSLCAARPSTSTATSTRRGST
mmetsp:Transcript_3798/g.9847  ORF Transcript_3798/g.9847 Transcript_3798/m.9847 type:complete len:214 (-) Transcript_3798:996-1637(-)